MGDIVYTWERHPTTSKRFWQLRVLDGSISSDPQDGTVMTVLNRILEYAQLREKMSVMIYGAETV